MLMVFKMVSPNVRVISVGTGRRCRAIQHDHDGCMAAGGHARAGALYLARAVNRGHAGPNLIYITLYGRRWQDLGGDLYFRHPDRGKI